MAEVVVTISGGKTGGMELYDLSTGAHLKSVLVANASGSVSQLDPRHLLLPQLDRPGIQCWSWQTGREIARSPLAEHADCVAVSRAGRWLAAGGRSGSVVLWDLGTGRMVRSWRAHYKAVTALGFSDDDGVLVSAGADALVAVWDVADAVSEEEPQLAALADWSDHTLPVTGMVVGRGRSPRVVTVSLDRTCRVWDLAARGMVASVVLPTPLHAVALAADEGAAYAAGSDGRIFAVDLSGVATGPQVTEMSGHVQRCVSLAVSFDGSLLLSASADGQCRVWELSTGKSVRSLAKKWPVLHGAVLVRDAYFSAAAAAAARSRPEKADVLPQLRRRPDPCPPLASLDCRVRLPADSVWPTKRKRQAAAAESAGVAELYLPAEAALATAAVAAGTAGPAPSDAGPDSESRAKRRVRKLEKEVQDWQSRCAELVKLLEARGGEDSNSK